MRLADGDTLEYDDLVLAAGSRTNYFGNDEIAEHALGLKDLGEALQLRNHVLDCLERAERDRDDDERRRLLDVLHRRWRPDRRRVRGRARRARAAGAAARVPGAVRLARCASSCSKAATGCCRCSSRARPGTRVRELERRGVDVRLNSLVASATDKVVRDQDGREIETATMIWTAGVQPSELTAMRPAPHTRTERIEVDEFLRILGVEHVYAIGDVAAARDGTGASCR